MLQARGKTLISLLSLSQTVSLQQLSLAQGFWESSLCPSFGKAHKVRAGKTELSSALQGQEIPTKISTKKKKSHPSVHLIQCKWNKKVDTPQNILGGALRAAGGYRAMQELSQGFVWPLFFPI